MHLYYSIIVMVIVGTSGNESVRVMQYYDEDSISYIT